MSTSKYKSIESRQPRAGAVEPLLTIPAAAKKLGVPVYAVRRAAKAGLFPVYHPFSNRQMVRLSDVEAAILEGRGRGGEL